MTTKELVKKVDMLDAMLTQAMKEVRRLTDEVERLKLTKSEEHIMGCKKKSGGTKKK